MQNHSGRSLPPLTPSSIQPFVNYMRSRCIRAFFPDRDCSVLTGHASECPHCGGDQTTIREVNLKPNDDCSLKWVLAGQNAERMERRRYANSRLVAARGFVQRGHETAQVFRVKFHDSQVVCFKLFVECFKTKKSGCCFLWRLWRHEWCTRRLAIVIGPIGVPGEQGYHDSPKFLAYLVVLCFERRCPKTKYCCLLKVKYLASPKILASRTLASRTLALTFDATLSFAQLVMKHTFPLSQCAQEERVSLSRNAMDNGRDATCRFSGCSVHVHELR